MNGLTVEERDCAEALAIEASKAAASKREAGASGSPIQSEGPVSAFDRFMEAFPAREGGHKHDAARSTYELNLSSRISEDEILAGAEAYARFCDAQGYIGTNWVLDANEWLYIGGWLAADPDKIPHDEESA